MVLNSQLDSGEGHTDARWAHPAGFLERTTGCGRRSDQSKTSGAIVAATRCSTSCCCVVPRCSSGLRTRSGVKTATFSVWPLKLRTPDFCLWKKTQATDDLDTLRTQ